MQMPGDTLLETTPLVIDGILYTAGMPGQVFAIDAKTGLQIWKYQRQQKVVNPYESNRFNRGVAVLGNRVFLGTLDAALVALDSRTGLPLWETQIADTLQGYSITQAPLALRDKIIVGVAGGEYGIRGFVDAYDPATGKRLWRFYAVPGPGEFGHDTWEGDSWQRGGGPTWLTGSYDPNLDILYWGVGNPGPDMDAEVRKGDNLFTCAVLALDASTGRRKWHYQFTPNDSHDWDATEDLVLVDRVFQGQNRKLLIQANRNGIFYVLDRTNGKFLMGQPFVRQTWNIGFDENGRPRLAPGWDSTPEGRVVILTVRNKLAGSFLRSVHRLAIPCCFGIRESVRPHSFGIRTRQAVLGRPKSAPRGGRLGGSAGPRYRNGSPEVGVQNIAGIARCRCPGNSGRRRLCCDA
jgi:alcohol dehydrogenase (cytochrome c)